MRTSEVLKIGITYVLAAEIRSTQKDKKEGGPCRVQILPLREGYGLCQGLEPYRERLGPNQMIAFVRCWSGYGGVRRYLHPAAQMSTQEALALPKLDRFALYCLAYNSIPCVTKRVKCFSLHKPCKIYPFM